MTHPSRLPAWPYTAQRLRQDIQLVDLWIRNAPPPQISTDRYVFQNEEFEAQAIFLPKQDVYNVYEARRVKSAIDFDYFEHLAINETMAKHVPIGTAIELLHQWTTCAVDQGYQKDPIASLGSGIDYRAAAIVFDVLGR